MLSQSTTTPPTCQTLAALDLSVTVAIDAMQADPLDHLSDPDGRALVFERVARHRAVERLAVGLGVHYSAARQAFDDALATYQRHCTGARR